MFIELTLTDGGKMMINTMYIEQFSPNDENQYYTDIFMNSDPDVPYVVRETYHEICMKLANQIK